MIGAHAALLAWKSGQPVKIMYDRLETCGHQAPPAVMRCRTGVRDGTLLAHDMDIVMALPT